MRSTTRKKKPGNIPLVAVGSPELAPQSVGQRVYGLMREDILSLKLAPNAELDEVQISRDYGYSRTPIREAIIRLAAEGLVVLATNRGARVAPLDLDQVPQVLEALELYERATTRWAALRRQSADIEQLELQNERCAAAIRSGNARAIVEANWSFHDTINRACGNQYLAIDCSKMLRSVMRLSLLAFRQENTSGAGYSIVMKHHDQMIDAIRKGDSDRAEALVYQHSDEFRERMKNFIAGASTAGLKLTPRR